MQQSDEPYRETDLLARRGHDLRRRRQVLSSPRSFHRRRNEEKRGYFVHTEGEKAGGGKPRRVDAVKKRNGSAHGLFRAGSRKVFKLYSKLLMNLNMFRGI